MSIGTNTNVRVKNQSQGGVCQFSGAATAAKIAEKRKALGLLEIAGVRS